MSLCFLGGYLKGSLPDSRTHFFWSSPEKIKLLVYSEKLIPDYIADAVQKKTHTLIEVDVSKTFNDYLAHIVSGADYSLMIVPRYWSEEFKKQNLILSVSGLKSFFQNKLNTDFQSSDFKNFPWAWTTTVFIKTKDTIQKNKSQAYQLKLIEDDDHIYQVLKKLEQQKIKIPHSLEAITLFDEAPEIIEGDMKEINIFEKSEYGENIITLEDWPKSLFLFDIVIPKNTPRTNTSIEVLQKMYENSNLLNQLNQESWAITTTDVELNSQSPPSKKPSFLRNQSLLQMIRPKRIEASEKQSYLSRFTVRSHVQEN